MKYNISGTTMQVVEVELEAGESVFTEVGGMAWMTEGVKMDTNMQGGIFGGLKRKLAGESLFMTTYTAEQAAKITFSSEYIGKIIDLNLAEGQSIIAQRDAFLAAQSSVKMEMHLQKKLGAGLFGGEGFILQKISGPGIAFLELGGEIVEIDLQAGERLKVDPGYVAAFDPTVEYNIERVKGIKNMFLGGEGMFLATVTGPGKVYMQTMPLPGLADSIARFLPLPRSTN